MSAVSGTRSTNGDVTGKRLKSFEVCAGGGGLTLGLEEAGFDPVLLLEIRDVACQTLHVNRPYWNVRQMDFVDFVPAEHDKRVYDVDLLVAGLPRVKAAAATNRPRGSDEEVALLKAMGYLTHAVRPRALLIENVPDLATKDDYADARRDIEAELEHLEYSYRWLVVKSAEYGVSQDRKQGILIAFEKSLNAVFEMPPVAPPPPSVGALLEESMASRGWRQASEWAAQATGLAPTLVGGSWDRGGPDLGPTGSKRRWASMGVNGGTVADCPPGADFRWQPAAGPVGMVRLTVPQAALIQGFPADWVFSGGKTQQYRQVGNASPPAVGRALGLAVRNVLDGR